MDILKKIVCLFMALAICGGASIDAMSQKKRKLEELEFEAESGSNKIQKPDLNNLDEYFIQEIKNLRFDENGQPKEYDNFLRDLQKKHLKLVEEYIDSPESYCLDKFKFLYDYYFGFSFDLINDLYEFNDNDNTLLMVALNESLWDFAKLLIKSGADVTTVVLEEEGSQVYKITALSMALRVYVDFCFDQYYKEAEGALEIIDLLLKNGANLHCHVKHRNGSFYDATSFIQNCVLIGVCQLIAKYKIPNEISFFKKDLAEQFYDDCMLPINEEEEQLAFQDHMEKFIQCGVNVNPLFSNGDTLLSRLIELGDNEYDMIKFLLKNNAMVYRINNQDKHIFYTDNDRENQNNLLQAMKPFQLAKPKEQNSMILSNEIKNKDALECILNCYINNAVPSQHKIYSHESKSQLYALYCLFKNKYNSEELDKNFTQVLKKYGLDKKFQNFLIEYDGIQSGPKIKKVEFDLNFNYL